MRILLLVVAASLAFVSPSATFANPPAANQSRPPADDDLPPAWKPEKNALVDKVPAFLGIFGPTDLVKAAGFLSAPGRWIEYEFTTADGSMRTAPSMRIQQVGPAPEGKRWLELLVVGEGIGEAGVRILTSGEGRGNVERVIAKGPGMPPLEMPIDSVAMYDDDTPLTGFSPSMEGTLRLVGRETVKVPLGTFEADHYVVEIEGEKGDYWVATDRSLPFLRVVKFSTPEGVAVARATGSDASARILVPSTPR